MDNDSFISRLTMPWNRFWVRTWGRRQILNGNFFPLEVFVLGLIFIAVPYFGSNNIAHFYLEDAFSVFPENSYDRSVPVINWMIIPYAALYLFLSCNVDTNTKERQRPYRIDCSYANANSSDIILCNDIPSFPS